MKIKLLLLLFSVGLMFSSCSKCQDCDCASGFGSGEVCQKDFGSSEEYSDAIDALEAAGCECK